MKRDISNSDNIIDSRDIIARIAELEDERSEYVPERGGNIDPNAFDDTDEGEELRVLKELAEDCDGYMPDWRHGEALIRESYFIEYARELAEDIGAIDPKAGWPLHCIDWERAADELKMDYSAFDFDGVTYYGRN